MYESFKPDRKTYTRTNCICFVNFYKKRQARNQEEARGAKPPLENLLPPGKICWTYFESIEHSLENLGHSQKTLRPPGVPSWLRAWEKVLNTLTKPSFVLDVLNCERFSASHRVLVVWKPSKYCSRDFHSHHCARRQSNEYGQNHSWDCLHRKEIFSMCTLVIYSKCFTASSRTIIAQGHVKTMGTLSNK